METKDTCLYIHTRKSDGGIFYVGIGDEKRPYSKDSRNRFWGFVVKKYDYDVTILKDKMSWVEACDLEIKMIAFYGRKDLGLGCLVNMTDGGDGAKGVIVSEERRKKISQNNIKNGNIPPSHKGKVRSEETKKKMIGKNNHMFGKTHTEETKKKISKTRSKNNLGSKKIICNITGKIYLCIKEASEDIGVNYTSLVKSLRGKRPNKTSLRYL